MIANKRSAAAAMSAAIVVLLMPLFMSVGGYYYDFPELMFMALTVWMAFRVEWWWLIPVVALAAWNKESFLLFAITLYPIFRNRYSRKNALIGTAVLCLTCAAVYALLRLHFEHNAGGTVEMQLRNQIGFMRRPLNIFLLEKTYGIILIRSFNPIVIVLALLTVWRGWYSLPSSIKLHAKIAAAINIPLFILFCAPGEVRDLSMLYVTFLLSIAANVTEWSGGPTKASFQHS